MIEKIEPWIKGKRILLLGYGREGQSTWNVLRRLGTYKVLDIADLKDPAALPEDGTVWHTARITRNVWMITMLYLKARALSWSGLKMNTGAVYCRRQRCFSSVSGIYHFCKFLICFICLNIQS